MAKILIVDDAAFMRMMIKDILTKNGYGSNERTGELTPPGMNFLDSWNKSLENILSHYKF